MPSRMYSFTALGTDLAAANIIQTLDQKFVSRNFLCFLLFGCHVALVTDLAADVITCAITLQVYLHQIFINP